MQIDGCQRTIDSEPRRIILGESCSDYLRRILFVAMLLCIGVISDVIAESAYSQPGREYANRDPNIRFWMNTIGGIGNGLGSVGVVLAIWLAGRNGILNKSFGRFRCFAYLSAFLIGGGSCWPAQYPDGSPRFVTDLFTLVAFIWLLLPTFALLNGKLETTRWEQKGFRKFSLLFLLGWISLFCILLVWAQVIAYFAAKYYDFKYVSSSSEVLIETTIAIAPEFTLIIASAILLVVAWSGKWWMPIGALATAIAVDYYGHELMHSSGNYFKNHAFNSHNMSDYNLGFLIGRNLIVWASFGAARLLGVQFRFGPAKGHLRSHRVTI